MQSSLLRLYPCFQGRLTDPCFQGGTEEWQGAPVSLDRPDLLVLGGLSVSQGLRVT